MDASPFPDLSHVPLRGLLYIVQAGSGHFRSLHEERGTQLLDK